ncbi:MAG: SIMPL domain-containing protein [Allosphingosinicella sp.]
MRLGGLRVAAAAAALLLGGAEAAADPGTPLASPSLMPGEVLLQVEATGETKSRPDVMAIRAGTVTSGRTANEALKANSALSSRLIDAIFALGLEARDVKTSELSVDPVMDESAAERQNREPRITGYVAKNRLDITLRDLGRASDVMDALFQAGANSVTGPNFSLSDKKPAMRLARAAAVAEARLQADTYADALGMRIARVIRVSERSGFDDENNEGIVITGSRIPRTKIEPGELTTKVTVWIDYALLPR